MTVNWDQAPDPEPVWSELLEAMTDHDVLEVVRMQRVRSGKNWRYKPHVITGPNGKPARLLVTATFDDLQSLVDHVGEPGTYRVQVKEQGRIGSHHDWLLQPVARPAATPAAPARAEDSTATKYEGLLVSQLQQAQEHNRTLQDMNRLLLEQKGTSEAKAAALEAELRTYRAQVGSLVDDLRQENKELKAAGKAALEQVTEMRSKLKDAEASPLDVIGSADNIFGMVEKTMRRFSDDSRGDDDLDL